MRAQWGVFRSIPHHPPKENLQQFMEESSPTFDFNDNNDNRSNNDGLWLPFPPSARQKKKKKEYSSKGRQGLINGGGSFSLPPPRTSATNLYHGSLLEERKTDELKWRRLLQERARRGRARQVALNWKRPKLEFSCQSWASWPPGIVSKPIAFCLYLSSPLSFFFVGALVSSLEQINSWMFIRKLRG